MIQEYSNQDMESFDQPALLKFLQEQGYSVTKATILRYIKNGYAMRSNRRSIQAIGTRIYYHPLTALEIMVAALLFKGDFLTPNSKTRIARFTGDDVFLARLAFYCDSRTEIFWNRRGLEKFATYVEHIGEDEQNEIQMELYAMQEFYERYRKNFFAKFATTGINDQFEDTYVAFLRDIYRMTYLHLQKKHEEKLREFFDKNLKIDCIYDKRYI